jgi:hypothetical protein
VTVFGESAGRIEGDVQAAQYGGRIEAQRWQDQAVLKDMEAINARKAGQIAATGRDHRRHHRGSRFVHKGRRGGQALTLFS